MKYQNNLQISGAIMAAMALAITAFPASSNAMPNDGIYNQALARNACRQISRAGGINVRQQPSINSRIIGRVANGLNVTIRNLGDNGWVRISAPLNGYVATNYLKYCS